MKDLMLIFAEVLTKEEIIKQLDEALQKYKAEPTEENEKGVEIYSMILLSKRAVTEDKDGAMGVIKRAAMMAKANNLLLPNEG